MPFVLDASATMVWAFDDEDHPNASHALDRLRTDSAIVPSLWWFEVRNTLVVNERRKRITEARTVAFLQSLIRLRIGIEQYTDEHQVLTLARRHTLSVYDAAYLELAVRTQVAMATIDRRLAAAADAESVPLVGAPR